MRSSGVCFTQDTGGMQEVSSALIEIGEERQNDSLDRQRYFAKKKRGSLMAIVWTIATVMVIAFFLRALHPPVVPLRWGDIATLGLLSIAFISACLFVEGPFEMFDAPFGSIARARRMVHSLGGEFEAIEPGCHYQVVLNGPEITDDTIMSVGPYIQALPDADLNLTNTSVTPRGVELFRTHFFVSVELEAFTTNPPTNER